MSWSGLKARKRDEYVLKLEKDNSEKHSLLFCRTQSLPRCLRGAQLAKFLETASGKRMQRVLCDFLLQFSAECVKVHWVDLECLFDNMRDFNLRCDAAVEELLLKYIGLLPCEVVDFADLHYAWAPKTFPLCIATARGLLAVCRRPLTTDQRKKLDRVFNCRPDILSDVGDLNQDIITGNINNAARLDDRWAVIEAHVMLHEFPCEEKFKLKFLSNLYPFEHCWLRIGLLLLNDALRRQIEEEVNSLRVAKRLYCGDDAVNRDALRLISDFYSRAQQLSTDLFNLNENLEKSHCSLEIGVLNCAKRARSRLEPVVHLLSKAADCANQLPLKACDRLNKHLQLLSHVKTTLFWLFLTFAQLDVPALCATLIAEYAYPDYVRQFGTEYELGQLQARACAVWNEHADARPKKRLRT